jgi:hypothetical protein
VLAIIFASAGGLTRWIGGLLRHERGVQIQYLEERLVSPGQSAGEKQQLREDIARLKAQNGVD